MQGESALAPPRRFTTHIHGWLLLLPAAVLLAVFTYYPAVATLIDSFYSTPKGRRGRMSTTEVAAKQMARSVASKVGNEVGRAIVRGVLGSLGGGKGR